MSRSVFWNRRSGRDRRHEKKADGGIPVIDERRIMDRRLYGNNGYLLVVGDAGIDRFTLFVTLPALVFTFAALSLSLASIF